MLTDAQHNLKRTAHRMDAWLDEVKRGPSRKKLLHALEIRGLRLLFAPDAQRDANRVSMAPPVVAPASPAKRARPVPRETCMSFEGCRGTGRWPDETDGTPVYCGCAAGSSRRVADALPPR